MIGRWRWRITSWECESSARNVTSIRSISGRRKNSNSFRHFQTDPECRYDGRCTADVSDLRQSFKGNQKLEAEMIAKGETFRGRKCTSPSRTRPGRGQEREGADKPAPKKAMEAVNKTEPKESGTPAKSEGEPKDEKKSENVKETETSSSPSIRKMMRQRRSREKNRHRARPLNRRIRRTRGRRKERRSEKIRRNDSGAESGCREKEETRGQKAGETTTKETRKGTPKPPSRLVPCPEANRWN